MLVGPPVHHRKMERAVDSLAVLLQSRGSELLLLARHER